MIIPHIRPYIGDVVIWNEIKISFISTQKPLSNSTLIHQGNVEDLDRTSQFFRSCTRLYANFYTWKELMFYIFEDFMIPADTVLAASSKWMKK